MLDKTKIDALQSQIRTLEALRDPLLKAGQGPRIGPLLDCIEHLYKLLLAELGIPPAS
jgi:hypothetical protein